MQTAPEKSPRRQRRPRRLGIARDYDQIQDIMRARTDELGLTRETIDTITGLPDRYTTKLLGKGKIKVFGRLSTGLVLEALGVELWVVENPAAMARMKSRYVRRGEAPRCGHVASVTRPRSPAPMPAPDLEALQEVAEQRDMHVNLSDRDHRNGSKRGVLTNMPF